MADTVASVYMFHAVFFSKCISNMEMSGVIHLAGRNEVVIDQNHLVRIPQLLKSHLFKFFSDKRDKDVVDHDAVHINGYNIARLYRLGLHCGCTIFSMIVCPIILVLPVRSDLAHGFHQSAGI